MENSEGKWGNNVQLHVNILIFLHDCYKRMGVFLKQLKITWVTLAPMLVCQK